MYKVLRDDLTQEENNLIKKFERIFEPLIQRVSDYCMSESKRIQLSHGVSVVVNNAYHPYNKPYVSISSRELLKNLKYFNALCSEAKLKVVAYCVELDAKALQEYEVMSQKLAEIRKINQE
jgi:hypothetical protein